MRTLARIAVASAVTLALRALVAAALPVPGEPAAVRWLRAAADHPVRTTAAVACVAFAFRRRSAGGPDAASASSPRPDPALPNGPPTAGSPLETRGWDVW